MLPATPCPRDSGRTGGSHSCELAQSQGGRRESSRLWGGEWGARCGPAPPGPRLLSQKRAAGAPATPATPCLALAFCFDWVVLWQKRPFPPRVTQAWVTSSSKEAQNFSF